MSLPYEVNSLFADIAIRLDELAEMVAAVFPNPTVTLVFRSPALAKCAVISKDDIDELIKSLTELKGTPTGGLQ